MTSNQNFNKQLNDVPAYFRQPAGQILARGGKTAPEIGEALPWALCEKAIYLALNDNFDQAYDMAFKALELAGASSTATEQGLLGACEDIALMACVALRQGALHNQLRKQHYKTIGRKTTDAHPTGCLPANVLSAAALGVGGKALKY